MAYVKQSNKSQQKKNQFAPYWYILPAVMVLLLITLYPLVSAIIVSLQYYNLLKPSMVHFVGLGNFSGVLSDSLFWKSLERTAYFTLGGAAIELGLGLLLALLFNREFWGKGLARTLILMPILLSPVAVGLIWRIFYDADAGMVNYFFSLLHLPVKAWLANGSTALPALIATDIWQWTPFCFIVCLAGLEGLSKEPYEAALIDGANSLELFRYITIPLMKPILVVVFVLRMIDSIKIFDLVFIMTNGGPGRATETVNFYIYQTGFRFFHVGKAASQSIILTFIVTIISVFLLRFLLKVRSDESV